MAERRLGGASVEEDNGGDDVVVVDVGAGEGADGGDERLDAELEGGIWNGLGPY